MNPTITLIVACDKKGAIGKDNKLPWRLPSELKHFKDYTMNKPLICGKNTFVSLPGILPGRPMFVLSSDYKTVDILQAKMDKYKERTGGKDVPFLALASSIDEILNSLPELYPDAKEICVIGGQQIYKQFYPYADKIIYTEVDCEIKDADAFFEPPNKDLWRITNKVVSNFKTDLDEYAYSILEFVKIPSAQIVSFNTRKVLNKYETIKLRKDSK